MTEAEQVRTSVRRTDGQDNERLETFVETLS